MGHEARGSEEQDRGVTEALWARRPDGARSPCADAHEGTAADATREVWRYAPDIRTPACPNLRL